MAADLLKLPNLLTLVRLASVPFVVQRILAGDHTSALALFLLAAVTDALDGFLARRFKQTTRTGAYFDPITDKIFLSAAYIALAAAAQVPWWIVILIFARDVLIVSGAAVIRARTGNRQFPPSLWGKASTFLQIACAIALLVHGPTARLLQWAVVGMIAVSGLDYLRRGVRMLSL